MSNTEREKDRPPVDGRIYQVYLKTDKRRPPSFMKSERFRDTANPAEYPRYMRLHFRDTTTGATYPRSAFRRRKPNPATA